MLTCNEEKNSLPLPNNDIKIFCQAHHHIDFSFYQNYNNKIFIQVKLQTNLLKSGAMKVY